MSIDLSTYAGLVRNACAPIREGRLCKAVGLVLEAEGCDASIGDIYDIDTLSDGHTVQAEVVGLRGNRTLLMPLSETPGLAAGAPLRRVSRAAQARVGDALLGRVVTALGEPLDGRPLGKLTHTLPLRGKTRNPLRRSPVDQPLWVGVRAIDTLLTIGQGQRIGVFAGGGVGKSTLLSMMVNHAEADVAVIALVGERGREVEEFVNRTLGKGGLRRSVVVAATSADTPLVRARGAFYATAIAEHFRNEGKHVLLVMDSLTRFAMAMREIGLSAGEPPTTKGYTPSVFAALPQLLERAGTSDGMGSITGIYTVLVEGDDLSDPIADAVRAILDGHIVLSRDLAERGHFPSIDVLQSISRVMESVVGEDVTTLATRTRDIIAAYREVEDLVAIGAYQEGAVPRLDEALHRMPAMIQFLTQRRDELSSPEAAMQALQAVWSNA